jgi:hypothetical protein
MIKTALREHSMSHTQVLQWFCHFKVQQTSVESNEQPRQQSKSKNSEMIDKVNVLLQSNRR